VAFIAALAFGLTGILTGRPAREADLKPFEATQTAGSPPAVFSLADTGINPAPNDRRP
jgi:hypothetical protein